MVGKVLAGIGVIILLIAIYVSTIYINAQISETINSIRNPYAELSKVFMILYWIGIWLILTLCNIFFITVLLGYIIEGDV